MKQQLRIVLALRELKGGCTIRKEPSYQLLYLSPKLFRYRRPSYSVGEKKTVVDGKHREERFEKPTADSVTTAGFLGKALAFPSLEEEGFKSIWEKQDWVD